MTDHEIDLAVAKKLGDHKTYWHEYLVDGGLRRDRIEPPPYCHSIEAAWEIVEFMIQNRMGELIIPFAPAETTAAAICFAFLRLP